MNKELNSPIRLSAEDNAVINRIISHQLVHLRGILASVDAICEFLDESDVLPDDEDNPAVFERATITGRIERAILDCQDGVYLDSDGRSVPYCRLSEPDAATMRQRELEVLADPDLQVYLDLLGRTYGGEWKPLVGCGHAIKTGFSFKGIAVYYAKDGPPTDAAR